MTQFIPKKFNIPALTGISAKNIEEHLKLYEGYVKHANLIAEKIAELKQNAEKNAYALAEVNRRLGFEYNGMRNHEVYFSLFEGGATAPDEISEVAPQLSQAITATWGSLDAWLAEFKSIALTRGIGWAMLYHDRKEGRLLNAWIDEQHLGQLQGCNLVIGLDMWEHSYVADYHPSGKKQYVEDFFKNINWSVAEEHFNG